MMLKKETTSRAQPRAAEARRAGYSFPEVLFAVAVLGIGFIMIAAIFPVALLQTQASLEETIGTAVTHNGVSYVRSPEFTSARLPYTNSNSNASFPAPAPPAPPNPGAVFGFLDPRIDPSKPTATPPYVADDLWKSVKRNLIVADDPRFAFIPMYIRNEGANFAKVIIIGVRVRNQPEFKEEDLTRSTAATAANLEPRPVKVQLTDGAASNVADRVLIEYLNVGNGTLGALSTSSNAVDAAVEGAYVIVSEDGVPDDTTTTPFTNEHGQLNGRVYRLGAELPSPGAGQRLFELAAGEDMPSSPGPDNNWGTADDIKEDMTDAIAFIVGRGYSDPANPASGYSGPSMAVQRYESIISLP